MTALEKFEAVRKFRSPGITPEKAIHECEMMASVANSVDAQTWYKLALEIKHELLLRPVILNK